MKRLRPEERHFGWAMTQLLAGNRITHPDWPNGLYWTLDENLYLLRVYRFNGYSQVQQDLDLFLPVIGFEMVGQ